MCGGQRNTFRLSLSGLKVPNHDCICGHKTARKMSDFVIWTWCFWAFRGRIEQISSCQCSEKSLDLAILPSSHQSMELGSIGEHLNSSQRLTKTDQLQRTQYDGEGRKQGGQRIKKEYLKKLISAKNVGTLFALLPRPLWGGTAGKMSMWTHLHIHAQDQGF